MSGIRQKALRTAARGHINHTYNGGSYLENHLERVALTAHAIAEKEGIKEREILDVLYCAALLHDYLEDCFDYSTTSIQEEFNILADTFNRPVANTVLILTKNIHKTPDSYYSSIGENLITKIIKAADRIANILSLNEVEIKKKRNNLYKKYMKEITFFEKYNIYPDLIKKSFEEIDKLLREK